MEFIWLNVIYFINTPNRNYIGNLFNTVLWKNQFNSRVGNWSFKRIQKSLRMFAFPFNEPLTYHLVILTRDKMISERHHRRIPYWKYCWCLQTLICKAYFVGHHNNRINLPLVNEAWKPVPLPEPSETNLIHKMCPIMDE